MSKLAKTALVLGGYVAACLIASAVVYVNGLFTQNAAAQASSGMYAFGDLILFIGVGGLLSCVPSGLALFFLLRIFLKLGVSSGNPMKGKEKRCPANILRSRSFYVAAYRPKRVSS